MKYPTRIPIKILLQLKSGFCVLSFFHQEVKMKCLLKGAGDGDGLVLRNRRMPGFWRRRRSRWTESARRRMSSLSVRFSERRKQSINIATDQARRLKTRAVDLFTRIRCAQGRVIRKEAKATRLVSTVLGKPPFSNSFLSQEQIS